MADDDETRAHDAQGPGEHVPGVQESEADQTESQPLIGGEPVQFLSYEDGAWSVIGQAAFTALGQYAFSYQYIPAPGTLALLLVAGVATHRRRRC